MEFTLHDRDKDTRTICLKGRFTHADDDRFLALTADVISSRSGRVVFDLQDLEHVESFALGLFLMANDEASRKGISVSFRNLQPSVRHMFNLTGMTDLLNVEGMSVPVPPRIPQLPEGTVSKGGRFHLEHRRNGERAMLVLQGRFTFGEIDLFVDAVATLAPAPFVELDLEHLEFMDSAALSAVIIAAETIQAWGGRAVISKPRGAIRNLLELTDMASLVPVQWEETSHAR